MGRAARLKKEGAARGTPGMPMPLDAYGRAIEALRAGNRGAAIVLLRQMIAEKPDHVKAHFNLATALREQADLPQAVAHYERVLALDPCHAEALANLGETLRRAGRLREAVACCDAAIAIDPRHAEAYLIRAVTRHALGDLAGALTDADRAIVEGRGVVAPYKVLARLLSETERKVEAVSTLQAGALVAPGDAEIFRMIGDLCDTLGRGGEAFVAYRKAIELSPHDVAAYANLSGLLCKTKMLDVALSVADVAIKLSPNLAGVHYNRGVALEKLERLEEALAAYAEALRVEPDSGRALISICRLKSQICDWDGLAASEGLARTLTYKRGNATSPFGILPMTSSPKEILECNRVWARGIDAPSAPLAPYAPRDADRRQARLRVGYLSADFHLHATAALIAEVFELHDKSRIETFGYSIGASDEGAMRRRLVAALDDFCDLSALSHDDAARRIKCDDIDILVDLKGFTFQARPEILARRPAPIQVNYLGYPSTMGASFVDYIIGDRVVTPFEHTPFYAEKIVQLPASYQPNDRSRPIAAKTPTRAACGLPEHGFVFCCFNASYKITPRVFDIWMRLLRDVPDSVLWLYAPNALAPANLQREAAARGIDAARLVFAPKLPIPLHLARMRRGDLFLDTSPVGAHTTASEALWVALPVLTYAGEAFAARVGASLVEAVGLPELVSKTLEAYEETARRLATDQHALRVLRERLAANRATAPLFDTPRYTRDLERAFARMAEICDAGERPRSFSI